VDRAADDARATQQIARVIVIAIGTSVLVITAYVLNVGSDRLPVQLVRFVLTILLALGLHRRSNPVRQLTIVLFGLASIGGLVGAALTGGIGGLALGALSIGYGYAMAVLWFDPSIRRAFGVDPELAEPEPRKRRRKRRADRRTAGSEETTVGDDVDEQS
jgi:hypothetical protein